MPNVGKVIAGALINTIDSHGPITRDNVGSAEKRVRRSLAGSQLLRDPGGRTEDLVARLRAEATDDADYVAKLERQLTERLRVNVGLMMEIQELKRERQEMGLYV